ncbi:MAG: hypothetical protein PSX80_07160 [bacterium]|nr:hypothetical protein [bacterium]
MPTGPIQFDLNFKVTGTGQVAYNGGETKGYPTYAVYAYEYVDGKTVRKELWRRPEGTPDELDKPMKPTP